MSPVTPGPAEAGPHHRLDVRRPLQDCPPQGVRPHVRGV